MNPFEFTTGVAIELSNLCQYSWLHKKCPLHLEMASTWRVREPKIISMETVYGVLKTLGKYGYGGKIYFNQYNEPLIDPRLFLFIGKAKDCCPESQVIIETNGHYLTRGLAQELMEAGVNHIVVTLYGDVEARDWPGVTYMDRGGLDDRLKIYAAPYVDRNVPCRAPLGQVVITRDAEVGLCCMDWKYRHTFGSLTDGTLEEILFSSRVRETYNRLSVGDRFLDICRRCKSHR